MIRITLIAVACLVALLQTLVQQQGVESLLTPQTQETGDSSQTSEANGEAERIQAEVAEIMAIREQLGGGVAATLGDLSLEMPGKTRPSDGSPEQVAPLDLEQEFANQVAAQSRENNVLSTTTNMLPNGHNSSLKPPTERQESVRHAARMLEEAAAILEEASEYDHADQVRKTASELWRAARKP